MDARSLLPLFQFVNDFAEILITDDKYDIGEFSSARHPSSFHHYQLGVLAKGLSDTAIQLITFSSRMLHSQESQAQSLAAIKQMMEDEERQRKAEQMRRVNMLMEYVDNLRGRPEQQGQGGALREDGTIDWSNAVYKGNLSDILARQDVQEEFKREYYRRQQAKPRQLRPIPALPAQILKPPKAPRLV